MYAIVDVLGQQLKVREGETVRVPKLDFPPGEEYALNKVLLLSTPEGVMVGRPYLEKTRIFTQVISHGRGEKVVVFKFKKRKNYRRKSGHRQDYTQLLVKKINLPQEA